jgi:hypothetical protein
MAFTTARVFEIAQEFNIAIDETAITPQFMLAEIWLAENTEGLTISDDLKEHAGACYVLHLLAKTPLDLYEAYEGSSSVSIGPMSVKSGGSSEGSEGSKPMDFLQLAYRFLNLKDLVGSAYPGEAR